LLQGNNKGAEILIEETSLAEESVAEKLLAEK
jgi:hypothetical protein